MKPAVLSQATDKAEALWHHREMGNFKTFKLEREGKKKKNLREESGSKSNQGLLYWQNKSLKINGTLQVTTCFICGQKEYPAHLSK